MTTDPGRMGFMSCDVRGVYPQVVNEPLFAAIGAALSRLWPGESPVLVAGDLRPSTVPLMQALASGLRAPGLMAMQPLPTPVAYFVAREAQARRTLVVTASHNPPQYNGLKLLRDDRAPSAADLCRLQEETARVLREGPPAGSPVLDLQDSRPWLERYAERLTSLVPSAHPVRVVVDPGNGCYCGLAAAMMRRLGHTVTEIHGRPDGAFPDRGPDPTAPRALADLSREVICRRADLGVAFDGDGDRAVFVDEGGAVMPGDATACLLATAELERHPGAPVVLDVRSSRALARALEDRGAQVLWSYPGHALVRTAMLDAKASFAGEISGHYFFADLGHDDGLYAALQVAALISRRGALGTLVADLPRAFSLPEARVPFAGSAADVFDALEAAFGDACVDRREGGLRLEWESAWALVRPSITEPLLTVRGEADSDDGLRQLTEALGVVLRPFGIRLG